MKRLALLAVLGLLVLASGCAHGRGAEARDLALAGEAWHVAPVVAMGLASGHDALGGPERLWLAEERRVLDLALKGEPVELWRAPRFSRILRFEAADLDGDGADEWVILLDQGRMRSVVVRLQDGVRTASRPWNGYLRPVTDPEGAVRLVGQRAGSDGPYRGRVTWVEEDEAGVFRPGESLDFPLTLHVYDFFWLPAREDQPARLFSVEETGHLVERDARSPKAVTWRSDTRFASRPVELRWSSRNMLGEEVSESLRLPPPQVLLDVDDVPGPEVLLVGGAALPVVVFENLRLWQGGDLRIFSAGPRGVEELRRTPLLGRAMVAATSWTLPDGRGVWAAAVWTRPGGGLAKPESRVFLFAPETGDILGGVP